MQANFKQYGAQSACRTECQRLNWGLNEKRAIGKLVGLILEVQTLCQSLRAARRRWSEFLLTCCLVIWLSMARHDEKQGPRFHVARKTNGGLASCCTIHEQKLSKVGYLGNLVFLLRKSSQNRWMSSFFQKKYINRFLWSRIVLRLLFMFKRAQGSSNEILVPKMIPWRNHFK